MHGYSYRYLPATFASRVASFQRTRRRFGYANNWACRQRLQDACIRLCPAPLSGEEDGSETDAESLPRGLRQETPARSEEGFPRAARPAAEPRGTACRTHPIPASAQARSGLRANASAPAAARSKAGSRGSARPLPRDAKPAVATSPSRPCARPQTGLPWSPRSPTCAPRATSSRCGHSHGVPCPGSNRKTAALEPRARSTARCNPAKIRATSTRLDRRTKDTTIAARHDRRDRDRPHHGQKRAHSSAKRQSPKPTHPSKTGQNPGNHPWPQ
jgi:hypothetical protein